MPPSRNGHKVLGLSAAFALSVVAARRAAAESPTDVDQGLAALEASDYEKAEADLRAAARGPKRAAATVGLARVQLATGRYSEAAKTAAAAQNDRSVEAAAATVAAEALARQGKNAEALALLQSVNGSANSRRARLLLGQLLIDVGRRAEAQDPLMSIIAEYNQNAIPMNDAEGLTLVGRAAHLLGSARDANDAYNQAEQAGGKKRVETLLSRAELFLDKYDPGHAEQGVKEALKPAPRNAQAHVAIA